MSSQALDPGWKSIPLEKFSFAVSPRGAGSHQWVHDARKDELFLVFRDVRLPRGGDTYETRLMMSVAVGTEILERQDVLQLAALAKEFEHRVHQGLVNSAIEAPVHVVIKIPCVAIRYPESPTLVRRIQMRFKNKADYEGAVNILKQFGLPIRNAESRSTPAAPTRPIRPASASIIQEPSYGTCSRPLQNPCLSTSYKVSAPTDIKNLSFNVPRPYSSEESPFFARPHTASSETVRPNSAWSVHSGRSSETTCLTSFGKPQTRRNSTFDPYLPVSSIFVSQHEKEPHEPAAIAASKNSQHSSTYTMSQNPDRTPISTMARAVSDAFGALLPRPQTNQLPVGDVICRQEFEQVRRSTSAHEWRETQGPKSEVPFNRSLSLLSDASRPVSAPVDIFSHWLPPKRELPFPKPRAVAKSHAATTGFAAATQSLQSAKENKNDEIIQHVILAASTPDLKQGSNVPAQRKVTELARLSRAASLGSPPSKHLNNESEQEQRHLLVERMEEPSPLAARSATLIRSSTAQGLQSKAAIIRSRKRLNETLFESPINKQARNMVNKSTQTQTLSGRDHTAPLSLISVKDPPTTVVNENPISSPPKSCRDEIDAFVLKHKTRPPPQELWETPGYAEATPEERQTILNDFICDNLDNEDFLQLCEDMADVWRRIGLEM